MSETLRQFFKQKTTIVGLITMLFFQLVFAVVWMNGYDGVTSRMDQLHIGVVSDDHGTGAKIADNLVSSLPFEMETAKSLTEAKDRLNARELQAVIYIPADFSAQLQQQGEKAKIEVLVNESNPAMVKTVGQQVLGEVTKNVNREVTQNGIVTALSQLRLPAEQAQGIAAGVTDRVEGTYTALNPITNFSYQMVPMMVVLASYVGSMLLSMQLTASATIIASRTNRWKRFVARQIINAGAAVGIGLAATGILFLFDVEPMAGFLELSGFLILTLFSFLAFAQMFLFLFGQAGMLFNIIALSLQLATSGTMLPRELLSETFHKVGDFLPATYAVLGNMNLLFGGTGTGGAVAGLLWITLAAYGVTLIGVLIHRDQAVQIQNGQKVVGAHE
ncbi:YhgE/Pip-like protein [Tumebacillus sp. BK434]|uniref:YhgE/Pip domain-containing protein n=1 Tax=Tumebacillus sp. BK434 TaxID=2512169 RepID=UPI00105404ED|nr:ABC transporter permease [Tumebacillus sp. BK434]TCP53802.1 YhgE/Pip-like protein [Tumebacillus sp. BK434]